MSAAKSPPRAESAAHPPLRRTGARADTPLQARVLAASRASGLARATIYSRMHRWRCTPEEAGAAGWLPHAGREATPLPDDDRVERAIAEHPDGMELSQIAEVLGIGRERVRQLVESALTKARAEAVRLGVHRDRDAAPGPRPLAARDMVRRRSVAQKSADARARAAERQTVTAHELWSWSAIRAAIRVERVARRAEAMARAVGGGA